MEAWCHTEVLANHPGPQDGVTWNVPHVELRTAPAGCRLSQGSENSLSAGARAGESVCGPRRVHKTSCNNGGPLDLKQLIGKAYICF